MWKPHPTEKYLRKDRIPHIWCPGCGIGTVVNSLIRALEKADINPKKTVVVSGIGCSGRVAGYLNLDTFHTTHGRAIPFATGLKLANPELTVIVISGDGDLIAIGGNHFIHAARRNVDINVFCINNLLYAMTGGQVAPTTPQTAITTTAPFGCIGNSMNLPFLAESSGAVYVSRWTTYHVRQTTRAMKECMNKSGFCFVEILSPCPTLYSRRNKLGDGLEMMKYYRDNAVVDNEVTTAKCDIEFQKEIYLGKFVDIKRRSYMGAMEDTYIKTFGDKYTQYKGVKCDY